MKKRIGFVGLGRMGANMARRLRETGWNVTVVHDARPDVARALAEEIGARPAEKLADVTAAADVIFTVVSDDKAQRGLFRQRGDSLLTGAKGRVFINCATVSPETHVHCARIAATAGARTIEACMASSINQARAGTLYLMCAGEKRTFESLRPLLNDLSDAGKLLRYIGAAGRAAQVKALVNMVMNINTAGLAEGLGLGAALGLDLHMLREVFSQTGADSRVLATDSEDMVRRDHAVFFSAAHAAKDSGIALDLARKAGLELPLAAATLGQYSRLVEAGHGELDKSGVAELTFPGRSGSKSPGQRRR